MKLGKGVDEAKPKKARRDLIRACDAEVKAFDTAANISALGTEIQTLINNYYRGKH